MYSGKRKGVSNSFTISVRVVSICNGLAATQFLPSNFVASQLSQTPQVDLPLFHSEINDLIHSRFEGMPIVSGA